MLDEVIRFLSLGDANVRYVLCGSILLGSASGVIGVFTLLQKRSLLGDALAHAALPGVACAFLLTLTKSILPLFFGASIAGILGVLAIIGIVKMGRVKQDAAIGITLSVFFGTGIVLLTYIQRLPTGNQSGLDKFLFGQAASMLPQDIQFMSIIAVLIIGTIILLFKELRLLIFDANYLAALGFPVARLDILLMFLVVLVVMIGLQAVGVVLMAALLITPAAGARFWTNKLKMMLVISALFGAISGTLGAFFSSLAPGIPTGPVMVLAATFFFVLSAISAPKRGLLAKWLLHFNNRQQMEREHFLRATLEYLELNPEILQVPLVGLSRQLNKPLRSIKRTANALQAKGQLIFDHHQVVLSKAGKQKAVAILKSHRLWEYYLLHRLALEEDHVHRDADAIEHLLSAEMIERLENILEADGIDTQKIVSVHPI